MAQLISVMQAQVLRLLSFCNAQVLFYICATSNAVLVYTSACQWTLITWMITHTTATTPSITTKNYLSLLFTRCSCNYSEIVVGSHTCWKIANTVMTTNNRRIKCVHRVQWRWLVRNFCFSGGFERLKRKNGFYQTSFENHGVYSAKDKTTTKQNNRTTVALSHGNPAREYSCYSLLFEL